MREKLWCMTTMVAALLLPGGAQAKHAPGPLFTTDTPLRLTLRAPFSTFDKPTPASLTVAGDAVGMPVTLATRGITRRNQDVCSFPPLRVSFTLPPPADSQFAAQKKLKLVTHCQDEDSFQQYVLLEYAAYRMYNLLTPLSYRVRLAQIDYRDARGKAITTRTGFFIEDTGDVADRNALHEFKTTTRANSSRLRAFDAARYAIFQLFISNLDWSMVAGPAGTDCCHNSKLLVGDDRTGPLVPVPYDFDFAGMVDVPYASPPEGIRVANVRQRLYRGYCRTDAEARASIADLVARRGELLAILDAVPQLADSRKHKAGDYLARFFDQVSTPDKVSKLLSTCVK